MGDNAPNALGRYTSEANVRTLCREIQHAQHWDGPEATNRNLKHLINNNDKKLAAFAAIALDLRTRFEAVATQFADKNNIEKYRISLHPNILHGTSGKVGWDRTSLIVAYVKTLPSISHLGDVELENGDTALFKGWETTKYAGIKKEQLPEYSERVTGVNNKWGVGLSISMFPLR